jgi:hypothetical protein
VKIDLGVLQTKNEGILIIYLNIKIIVTTFKLNTHEVNQVKNLIFDKIDEVGGIDQLSDKVKSVLKKLSQK